MEAENEMMLASSVSSISAQVEYAKNRLAEGKRDWVGPWMMGEALRIAALQSMSTRG
jgi:hypothetical protein